MKDFSKLIYGLDHTHKDDLKINAIVQYFEKVDPQSAIYSLALLSNKNPRRVLSTKKLEELGRSIADLRPWLYNLSHERINDKCEVIALILSKPSSSLRMPLNEMVQLLDSLTNQEEPLRNIQIADLWTKLGYRQRYVLNKLITGTFRSPISPQLLVAALARLMDLDQKDIVSCLVSDWSPERTSLQELFNLKGISKGTQSLHFAQIELVDAAYFDWESEAVWLAERWWNGIRSQIVVGPDKVYIWSEAGAILNSQFPEFQLLINSLDVGTIISGEIVCHDGNFILRQEGLKKRFKKKKADKKSLIELPAKFIVYDILKLGHDDVRKQTALKRRNIIDQLVTDKTSELFLIPEYMTFNNWEEFYNQWGDGRNHLSQGILLKKSNAKYDEHSSQFLWKTAPITALMVLLYVTRGDRFSAKKFSEFTFGVKFKDTLVPVTKIQPSLSIELEEHVYTFAKENTLERFGPVRSIKANLIFTISFDEISYSSRHKSGVTLRNSQILRWNQENSIEDIDSLADLNAYLK